MSGAAHFLVFAVWSALTWPSLARAQAARGEQPSSEAAIRTAELGDVLFAGAAIIFVAMAVLIAFAVFGPARIRDRLSRPAIIYFAGIAFPVIVLTVLLSYTLGVPGSMKREAAPRLQIEVVGEIWWWRVRYQDASGSLWFETANEIRIPAGVPVDMVLKSDNVIHSFWAPELGGKLDMIPGHVNRMTVQAEEPGVFHGVCAEYCGAQHAKMRFSVHALAPEAFDAWMSAQRRPAREAGPELQPGAERFVQACAACHTVRGTAAAGTSGPDLTHVGSRSSLAAGTLPNNVGALAGWIAASQRIKPGNPMPSFDHWSGEELRAVATYLQSLK
ncbi:cytochrome c oxidase subunit II [Bordetella genomosp. 4]|uniref:cytochrome c oxidase subunit II n=1 Tax=Bordetella genomosp. 4 TaxID=463044 RepID=UPI000B9EE70B|nr:cytochrome c oxidase subunit II [Bordetella genomosp. 4]OZI49582.1 cytochrome c oxidase subunit II [Bordetella genomosp. 4]